MTTYSADAGMATLMQRERIASFAIYGVIAVFAMTLLGEVLELAGTIDLLNRPEEPLALVYTGLLLANFVIFSASVIAVAMWIHRAHANLHEAGFEPLNFTPGWAVGWYFVPIANLFKPFQAMRELWNTSHGLADSYSAPAPGNLPAWWGLWIAGNILGNISTRLEMMGDGSNLQVAIVIGLASSLCVIGSAWLLLGIIRAITAAQRDSVAGAGVFE
ncbi:MAG: DUF4328 domain-containing protein [Porphyrobacter sp.]|nr:DUF4328 domain-containing protein [Porphyrobacter sp.]